jgi:hypothetical protein
MNVIFHEPDHTYRDEGGVLLPSVTLVINSVLVDPETRRFSLGNEEAMERGRKVHEYCQQVSDLLAAGEEIDEDSIDQAYVAGWIKFIRDSGYKPEAWEGTVCHATYRYAGRYDTRGRLGKKAAIVDIKTGGLPETVGVQLAAYAEATGLRGLARYSVQLPGDGNYRLTEWTDRADWPTFCGALAVYNWKLKKGMCDE